MKRIMGLIVSGMVLSSCACTNVQDYAKESPVFSLRSYFDGPIEAHGLFQKPSGKVVNRFVVQMIPTWNADTLVLDESFVYADGKRQKRIWKMIESNGKVKGWAGDVIGAAKGEVAGNAFHWSYQLALDVDGSVYHVHMDDWMYRMDGGVVLNRTRMSKWGWHLGDVFLVMRKVGREPMAAQSNQP